VFLSHCHDNDEGRKEGRKEAQDAADLQSFSQTNTAAAADWLKSQIAHLPDQW
jgi:hypothetical protein